MKSQLQKQVLLIVVGTAALAGGCYYYFHGLNRLYFGTGEFQCNQPGLYKIYFESSDEMVTPPRPDASSEEHARYLANLKREPEWIRKIVVCQITAKGTGALVPLAPPLPYESLRWSSVGGVSKMAYATFVAPQAGIYKFRSYSNSSDLYPFDFVVIPQGWCDVQPQKLYRSSRRIPKGKVLSADDLAVQDLHGSPSVGPQPPHNIVGDELGLVGCTARRDISNMSYLRYSDIELPPGKASPR